MKPVTKQSRHGDLAARYGLTPAELRLAQAFLTEASIKEAAKRTGLTRGTARQYLKRIYQKTGTHNQAQLMKLLLTQTERDKDP